MKKNVTIFICLFSVFIVRGQKKPIEKSKDTVKTEVVNVVTAYNPEIADASKIKKNPTVKLLEKSKRKQLEYTIFSAPVASTFIPKSGVVKGIDVGVKERLYKNYIAAGFGNYLSPYFEVFLHHSIRFDNEFGFFANYSSSEDSIENTVLDSNFSNFKGGVFFRKEDRYFDWKVSLNSERNVYNWYGLPQINFSPTTIDAIEEKQAYNYFQLIGNLNFEDSYIDFGKISLSYFTDLYKSNEILIDFNTKLDVPLDFLYSNLKDLSINTNFEFLKGEFKNSYQDENPMNYSLFTVRIHPQHKIEFGNFSVKYGLKAALSLDMENSATNFLLFPNIRLDASIIKNYVNAYGGYTGDLHTNTYKKFTELNPYVSPTLLITQTVEKSTIFLGFQGKINNSLTFNFKGSLKEEQDKPLFLRNNSKSDGVNSLSNQIPFKGYEYGNSFNVFYDDVKTTTLFAELAYDLTKRITFGTTIQQDSYTPSKISEVFNFPTLEASIFGKYKSSKWYATTNIFYVNERKDVNYNGAFPSSFSEVITVDSFIDVNLNGGYHFNDKFSAFLNLKNILNTKYQRFANFDTQGFQVVGGITYKFDF